VARGWHAHIFYTACFVGSVYCGGRLDIDGASEVMLTVLLKTSKARIMCVHCGLWPIRNCV